MTESRAIATAVAIVKNPPRNWGAEARAAAAKAAAEWEAKKGASHAKAALQHSAGPCSIMDEFALRDAALLRLAVFEGQFGVDGMIGVLGEGMLAEAAAWSPTLKRAVTAPDELERHEVYDGGQHVGTITRRKAFRNEPDRYDAYAINGQRVTDYNTTRRPDALKAIQTHLEEAPARVIALPAAGKFLVAQPSSYSGQVSYRGFPTEQAARHAAGLPAEPTLPERNSKIEAVAEMLRFDLMTVSGLDIPPLRRVQEARRRDPFDLVAEEFHPGEVRDFHGRWMGVGAGNVPKAFAAMVPAGSLGRGHAASPAAQRYEGGVARMSAGTRRELQGVFTPAERGSVKERQPAKDLDELYKIAAPHREQLTKILTAVAGKLDGKVHAHGSKAMEGALGGEGANRAHVLVNSLKGRPRATAKVNGKYNGDASRLNDVVRGAIAVPHVNDLAGAVRSLRESLPPGWKLTSPENRFVTGGHPINTGDLNGYRDIAVNLRSAQGFNVEVQITTTHMLQAKNVGHKLYEERRLLVENGVTRQLSRADAHRRRQLDAQAKRIYDAAMTRSARMVRPKR